ncbi:MAG: hypothetical protein L0K86_17835 [Actinomycetia bacterium]|nr:hypothetical protein [Actinomycetes bacterium]
MITTDELVDKIKSTAPRVRLEGAGLVAGGERFIVEGDIGLTEDGVLAYAARRIEIAMAPDQERQGLLGIERDGKILRWRPGTVLTYAVWRPSFSGDAEYQAVVAGIASATAGWQSLCGVEFRHVNEKDTPTRPCSSAT